MENEIKMQVAVIGAGPAGIFAAEALSSKGYGVALFNRDIKPGGLAEYGIFPDKHKLKNGLRTQFRSILNSDKISYYGNIHIGVGRCIELHDLFQWGFEAVLVTCGAQGVKSLHIPGETLEGVINAKDLVYYYNQLPPFSLNVYRFGRKAAIVGAGNVMADITHFLLKYTRVEEITVIIRRGPAEVKFEKKEMEPIISYLDLQAFDEEIQRVSGEMVKMGQDPQKAKEAILAALPKAYPMERNAKILFHFLASPKQIIGEKKVSGIEIEKNELVVKNGETSATGTGRLERLDVDNVIFAIGDRVLDELGLPMNHDDICKAKTPLFEVDGNSFEVEDPATGKNLPGIFIAGWSRRPSTGLVGIARKDGVNASEAVDRYLVQKESGNGISKTNLEQKLNEINCQIVKKEHLLALELEEKIQAEKKGQEEFKYSTNKEMLKVIGLK